MNYGLAKLRQHFINAKQVTTLALWCKIMQHNSGGTVYTILAANSISNSGKFAKMVHPDFLVKIVVKVLITLT